MSDNHQPPPGDVLDRAAAAVRGAAGPPPPADLLAATVAAVHNRLALAKAADAARRRRRRFVMRATSVGGLAACLAVAAGLFWGGGTAEAHFREAMDNAAQARSVKFTERLSFGRKTDQKFGHQLDSVTTVFVQGERMRDETGTAVNVIDEVARTAVFFDTNSRTAFRFDPSDGSPLKKQLPNLVDQLAKFRGKGAEAAGQETVKGVPTLVYRVKNPELWGEKFGPADECTVWIDPKTDLPVRIRVRIELDDPKRANVLTLDDFTWNSNLDPKLFDTAIPAGYTVVPLTGAPSPEKTRPVSLKLAAEAVAVAPCMVVTNTQRLLPGRPELVVKMYARRTQFRMEFPNPGGEKMPDPKQHPLLGALVFDADSDRSLHLNFGEKTAKFEKRQGLRPATFPDLAAGFRRLKDEDGEAAGEEAVDGKPAKVFKLKNADFIGARGPDVVTTVWLDAATSLPVRVRVTDGTTTLEFDRFEWPATLADGLFSLVPPKGYTVGEFAPPGPPAKK